MKASARATRGNERQRRAGNLRTGLILASIAFAFFLGFLLRRYFQ
jgi:hypothetical protein